MSVDEKNPEQNESNTNSADVTKDVGSTKHPFPVNPDQISRLQVHPSVSERNDGESRKE